MRYRSRIFVPWAILLLALIFHRALASDQLRLQVIAPNPQGWIQIEGQGDSANQLINVQASSNLINWETVAVLHGAAFSFVDPGTPTFARRYYRFTVQPLYSTNDWKNQVFHPYDPFRGYGGANEAWIKFVILADEPTRVYYSDSRTYNFHYEFVRNRVTPFIGISPAEFESISQHNTNRQIILGSLLFPGARRNEYGIQFVTEDPLPNETIRNLFELVRSTVIPNPEEPELRTVFYIPTFGQSAHIDQAYFASNGIPVTSPERWAGGNVCYSAGWALGTLKFFATSNVPSAYANGQLAPSDILLTDGIPAELPYVAGIISLTPSTPNSHVAILAQSYNVPFAFILDNAERARILSYTNQEIAFQTGLVLDTGGCSVFINRIDGPLDPQTRHELFALRSSSPIQIVPKERYGSYTASTDGLEPADIKYFGGKAANYGVIRRSVPTNSYPAIAISFDLWDDFMNQTLGSGKTLREEITNRLANHVYPPNVGALQTNLAAIRSLIRGARFTPAQMEAITNALGVFDSQKNIRFRSSTNVEDAESFSGAGLYDSYSGCLADDLDANTIGPSICDPTENDERGVFRAIARVYASFFNDNAFLERLRLGVSFEQAGMAILVHHSTPDEIEMANGVATGTFRRSNGDFSGILVTQLGSVSVANPDGSAVPEEVEFYARTNSGINLSLRKSSSLRRLGESVMDWDSDYRGLATLISRVANAFGTYLTNKPIVKFDLEYKKVSPGTIEIKQIREIPTLTNKYFTPLVLNKPGRTFSVWQGYYGNIFSAHKLKSKWTLENRNLFFNSTNLAEGFYTHASVQYLNGSSIVTMDGPLESFPSYSREIFTLPWNSNGVIEDSWSMPIAEGQLQLTLRTSFDAPAESLAPFRTIPESMFNGLYLTVQFPVPVLDISPFGAINFITNYSANLYMLRPENSRDISKTVNWDIPAQGTNATVQSLIWFPEESRGWDCRCPILRIVESRVAGFTTEPLVLRGYWSQTYGDIHTHSHEQLLIEPSLDEELSLQQREELAAANIKQIYVNAHGGFPVLLLVGFDGSIRRFSDAGFD